MMWKNTCIVLCDFSNRYVDCLWFQQNITTLMGKFGYPLSLDEEEAVEMLDCRNPGLGGNF